VRLNSHLAWALPGLLLWPLAARADDQPKPAARVAAAVCASESGSLLRREAGGKEWKPVAEKEELFTGDLLIGGLDSALESRNGAVRVENKGDHADKEPLPVLETGLVLNPARDVDLDFALERGRIRVTNIKKSGAAKLRITIHGKPTEYELPQPGDSFAIEIFGRWLAGTCFKKEADEHEGPALAVVFLQIKGETHVKGPKVDTVMKAPPGIALFVSGNLDHDNPEPPRYLDKLPAWAIDSEPSAKVKKVKEVLAKMRKAVMSRPVGEVLDEFVKSDDPAERRAAIVIMGATDDLERLADALMNAKHADVWDNAVIALRHWIGRCPCQDQKLYQGLIEKRGYKPAQAEVILNLLHSFGEEDLCKPETYELLINYLESDKLGIRGLAYWHLSRLVPQGQRFGYDPLSPKEKREEAIKKWRELIPEGQLPPKPKLLDLLRGLKDELKDKLKDELKDK
jgi:hypothetical protein